MPSSSSPPSLEYRHSSILPIRSYEYFFWDVNIEPLEAFQSLEKRVILIALTGMRVERDVARSFGLYTNRGNHCCHAKIDVRRNALVTKRSRVVNDDGGSVLGDKAVGVEDGYDENYET